MDRFKFHFCLFSQIALNGLEVLLLLVDLQRSGFRHYLPATIPNLIDKLGDAKDIVRESTQVNSSPYEPVRAELFALELYDVFRAQLNA